MHVMATSDPLDEDALLRRLSGELARLHSWEDVAAYVIGAAVQLLGGNTGSLCLLTADGRELEIVAKHGYSLEVTAVWTRFRVDAPLPASEAVRTGKAVFITSPADRDMRYPIFREQPVVDDAAGNSILVTPRNNHGVSATLTWRTVTPTNLPTDNDPR